MKSERTIRFALALIGVAATVGCGSQHEGWNLDKLATASGLATASAEQLTLIAVGKNYRIYFGYSHRVEGVVEKAMGNGWYLVRAYPGADDLYVNMANASMIEPLKHGEMSSAGVQTMANRCINNLRQISGAKDQYALEHYGRGTDKIGDLVSTYIARMPECSSGGSYTLGPLGEDPTCTTAGHTL